MSAMESDFSYRKFVTSTVIPLSMDAAKIYQTPGYNEPEFDLLDYQAARILGIGFCSDWRTVFDDALGRPDTERPVPEQDMSWLELLDTTRLPNPVPVVYLRDWFFRYVAEVVARPSADSVAARILDIRIETSHQTLSGTYSEHVAADAQIKASFQKSEVSENVAAQRDTVRELIGAHIAWSALSALEGIRSNVSFGRVILALEIAVDKLAARMSEGHWEAAPYPLGATFSLSLSLNQRVWRPPSKSPADMAFDWFIQTARSLLSLA